MHRQAMLVSLSLSPASTSAKNDSHWAFLEEIDAPQWADLKAEEALAKAGTIGDDPWFYRSHSHHEVPLTEITGGHAADIKDSNASGNVRTPNLERKKNRGSSKAKLAFDGATAAKPKETAREDRLDESPRADYSSGCHDTFGDSPRNRIASPVHCKSPEKFLSARRFISSATSDDYVAGGDGTGVVGSSNLRVNIFENQYVNEKMSTEPDMPVISTILSGQPAGARGDEVRPSQPSLPWQDTIFPRLNDVSRLRKSLGSALRVKIDDSADNPSTKRTEAATLPKSRLVGQSVQLEAAALRGVGGSERDTTFSKKDTASLRNENGFSNGNCQSDRVRSSDGNSGTALANKLGINSSVQAFDDIRKMRKSWGSALRVKVSDDPPVEDLSSKPEASVVSPVSDAKGDCSSVKPNEVVVDLPSIVDMTAISTGSEEKKLPGISLPSVVRANERIAYNPREALGLVKELEVSSPKVIAAGAAKKMYRRSVSFDHTPGRGPDIKTSMSSRSSLMQQKQGSRASPISRLNAPVEKLDKASRLSKGGKENTSLHSSTKATKLNPEPSVGSPRMSRQSVTRMSMPSLTFAAHARAAMGANGGGTILKASGLNSVVETNRSDSSKAAAPVASAARKSAVGLDNGTRKKTAACPATVTNPPSKMVTRQSILRSSMPVFSASAAKQASKPVPETVTALKSGAKNGSKIGNGDADLAALLAEHNRKFRPKAKYEPRLHSVKDIREWEARTGQMFYNLLPAEREKANQEISAAKQTRQK